MKETQKTVDKFNQKFPVGATVRWRSVGKPGVPYREYTVQHAACNHNGTAVAWFAERTGMVSVEPAFVDYEN